MKPVKSFHEHLATQVSFLFNGQTLKWFLNCFFYKSKSIIEDLKEFKEEICFVFDLKEKIGALADALRIFEVFCDLKYEKEESKLTLN